MVSLRTLFAPRRPEPSYPNLPVVDDRGRTSVDGLYAAGEVAGTPLLRPALNAGRDWVAKHAAELLAGSDLPEGAQHVLIVGAGPTGLAAAAEARARGLEAIVVEAGELAQTVQAMTRGKVIYAEPAGVENRSDFWFEECTREELLERWTQRVTELGLDVRLREEVTDVRRTGELFEVVTNRGSYRARRVLLAMGKAGNPRQAGVPGELDHAGRIDHSLADPDRFRGADLVVYGGGDVALEAALALCETNRVTLITIDPEFTHPSRRNIDAALARQAEGKLAIQFDAHLKAVGERDVTFTSGGSGGAEVRLPADHLFEMIGAELPLDFFARIGVRLREAWTPKRWIALILVFLGVYGLYSIKSYGKGLTAWPFSQWIEPAAYDEGLQAIFSVAFAPFAWLFREEALRDIHVDRGYQQGFLYSLLYTILLVAFAFPALKRWRGVARDPRYQTWRYASIVAFQVGFFLIVNVIAVEALTVKYAWRAWGLYQPFPLFFNVFFWWYESDPAAIVWFFVGTGLLGTFVVMPLLARFHGKRFCSWVCGCGGMAETLGDRWRHLAPHGARSRAWEFQGGMILAASALVALVIIGVYETEGNNPWWHVYAYLVDFWLVAVIPMALYPFFGGKIWCRYWCPLAAWNHVLSAWFGKLRIRSNSKCISCTQCSTQCLVGVDVMAFARNRESFSNENSACIQCGICIDVCPVDVLSFDSGGEK